MVPALAAVRGDGAAYSTSFASALNFLSRNVVPDQQEVSGRGDLPQRAGGTGTEQLARPWHRPALAPVVALGLVDPAQDRSHEHEDVVIIHLRHYRLPKWRMVALMGLWVVQLGPEVVRALLPGAPEVVRIHDLCPVELGGVIVTFHQGCSSLV